jgi:hypothetical protein
VVEEHVEVFHSHSKSSSKEELGLCLKVAVELYWVVE